MNLPLDILRIIPFDGAGLKNSPTGELPDPSYGFFGELAAGLLESIVGGFIALFGPLLELFNALIGWAQTQLLSVAVALGASDLPFVEKIFKATVLVYIYLIFAITLFDLGINFLFTLAILIPFIILNGGDFSVGFLSYKFSIFDMEVQKNTNFKWEYCSFMDLSVPVVIKETLLNGILFFRTSDGIIFNHQEEPIITEVTEENSNNPIVLESGESLGFSEQTFTPEVGFTNRIYKFTTKYNGPELKSGWPQVVLYKDGNYVDDYDSKPMYFNSSSGEYCANITIKDPGKYDYKIVGIDINDDPYGFEDILPGPLVTLSPEDAVTNIFKGINFIFPLVGLSLALLNGAVLIAKPGGAALIATSTNLAKFSTGILLALLIVITAGLFVGEFVEKMDDQTTWMTLGVSIGCFIIGALLATTKFDRSMSISTTKAFAYTMFILILTSISTIFTTFKDVFIFLKDNTFFDLIFTAIATLTSLFLLSLAATVTVALIYGKKGAISQPKNVGHLKPYYSQIIDFLIAFALLNLILFVSRFAIIDYNSDPN